MSQLFFQLEEFGIAVRWFILGGLHLSTCTPPRVHLGIVFQELLLEVPDLPEAIPRWKEEILALVQEMARTGQVKVRGDYSLPASLMIELQQL